MNIILKSMLWGIAVVIAGFVFTAFFCKAFNGMPTETSTVLGIGLFTCFSLVLCTGIIISHITKLYK